MSSKRLKMTVEMDVTVPQGLALQAMFKHWNRLASWGSSRMIAFYVDGDGNFKPKCTVSFSEEMPELTEELEKAAVCDPNAKNGELQFDFDPIAWKLHEANENNSDKSIKVSPEQYEKFVSAIESPPQPNEALKNAMSKFREDQGHPGCEGGQA